MTDFRKIPFLWGVGTASGIAILIYFFGCSTQYVPEKEEDCSPYIVSWQETLKDRWMYIDAYELRDGCAGVMFNGEARVFCGTFQIKKNKRCE